MQINSAIKKLKIEISKNKFTYIFLSTVLLLGFLLRTYRINDLLAFHFDQGRDAAVIWDLIKNKQLFLIGPTTGLAGIFRGPYYYYLIAPLYFLGNGNPIFPSVFLSLTTVLASLLGFHLGCKIQNRATGIIFALLSCFSFYILTASRWLSNPTPMFLLSMFLVWTMFQIMEGKKWAWPILSFIAGLSLFNFGSSGELFYFVSIAIFFVWQWKNRPDFKSVILSVIAFSLTFLPLVVFDLKHEHILLNNIVQTFGKEKSFTLPYASLFESRNHFYANLFPRLLFHSFKFTENLLLISLLFSFILFSKKLVKNTKVKVVMLLLISPIVGLYFYQGNQTVLYDYYMTGYFLIFLLFVAIILGKVWTYKLGKIFVGIFLLVFLLNNWEPTKFVLSDKSDNPESIVFVNQKQAMDWIYKDAGDREFNVDVYVPPVIPHSYDYLFKWLGTTKYNKLPNTNRVELLYTLYEVDPPHPERLQAWLDRQNGIGKVYDTYKTGGITVERRLRIQNAKENN